MKTAPRVREYQAKPFRGRPNWWFGYDNEERPVLLVADQAAQPAPDIETIDLVVLRSRQCVISGHERLEGRFTILACRSASPELQRYFADLCADLERWSREDEALTVADIVSQLVHFFRQLRAPSRKSEQGVWGELLIIASSERSDELIHAWHREPSERYDFSSGPQRIEVKTSSSDRRIHHFSLAQLSDPLVSVCVVSLTVEASAGGATVADLVDAVLRRDSVSAEDAMKVRRVVADSLGEEWIQSSVQGYDRRRALATARCIRASDVPSIQGPLPREVSEVNFMSDVSQAPALKRAQLAEVGGIWAAAESIAQA